MSSFVINASATFSVSFISFVPRSRVHATAQTRLPGISFRKNDPDFNSRIAVRWKSEGVTK